MLPPSNPGVRFPPPILFLAGLLAGWALERAGPSFALPGGSEAIARLAGMSLVGLGAGVIGWGMMTFLRARTSILPHHAASTIVDAGPYRFTRNPMYLGMTIAYLGGTLLVRTVWPLLLLPAVIALLVRFVIAREEAYLGAAFPDAYAAYCARVRRWV